MCDAHMWFHHTRRVNFTTMEEEHLSNLTQKGRGRQKLSDIMQIRHYSVL